MTNDTRHMSLGWPGRVAALKPGEQRVMRMAYKHASGLSGSRTMSYRTLQSNAQIKRVPAFEVVNLVVWDICSNKPGLSR